VSTYTHAVKSKKFDLLRFASASVAVSIIASVVALSSSPLPAAGSAKVTFKPAPVQHFVNAVSRNGKTVLQSDSTLVNLDSGTSVSIPGSYSAMALDRDGSQALLLDTNGRAVRRTVATGVNQAVPVPASWFASDEISLNVFEPAVAMSGDGSVVAYLHVNSARFLGTRVLITTMTGTPIEVTPHVQTTAVNNEAASLSMSADGRFLVFAWRQFDVGCTTPNELWCTFRIYRYDRTTGTTERVDVDPNGASSLGFAGSPVISDNGRFVAFVSDSPTIVAGLTARKSRLFLRDMRNGITHFITDMSVATQTSPRVSMSGDGLRVLYEDRGPIAVAGTTYDNSEVIRFADLSDGTVVTIGPSDGSLPNNVLRYPFVNQSGDRFVVGGGATNITSPVAPADTGVFVGTLAAAAVLKLTLPSGEQIDLDRDLVSQSRFECSIPARVARSTMPGPSPFRAQWWKCRCQMV
jgi:hypothetical protein